MITLQDIKQAETDSQLAFDIVRQIMYDGNKPKLRMYLYKMGVKGDEAEELELICSSMIIEYLRGKFKGRYHHDKIPFERFMWNSMIQVVLNELKSKNTRNSRYSSIDKIMVESEIFEPQDWMGTSEIEEFPFDAENMFMLLTQRQSFICRCIYYNDWKEFEIQDYLEISKEVYSEEMEEIKKVFINHR